MNPTVTSAVRDILVSGITLGIFYLGYKVGKDSKSEPTKTTPLLCAHIDKLTFLPPEDSDFPMVEDVEPCNNLASSIVGGKTLCENHYEDYLDEMTTTVSDE